MGLLIAAELGPMVLAAVRVAVVVGLGQATQLEPKAQVWAGRVTMAVTVFLLMVMVAVVVGLVVRAGLRHRRQMGQGGQDCHVPLLVHQSRMLREGELLLLHRLIRAMVATLRLVLLVLLLLGILLKGINMLFNSSGKYLTTRSFAGLPLWIRQGGNPILVKGASGKWDDQIIYRPYLAKNLDGTAYKDGSGNYYLYFIASGTPAGVDNDRTGLALSTDLLAWTRYDANNPVLDFGGTGTFDRWDAQFGSVLQDNGTFHMWYGGNNNASSDYVRLGYAYSSDGKTWTKYGSNPILAQGPADDSQDLYQPIVIKDESIWKMWYCGHTSGKYRLMYATAPAPEGPWTRYSNYFVLDPGFDIFPADVIKMSNLYALYFYNIDADPYTLRLATSADGITWTIQGTVLGVGGAGEWDHDTIMDGVQVKIGSDYLGFYAGRLGSTYGIGSAIIPLPTHSFK